MSLCNSYSVKAFANNGMSMDSFSYSEGSRDDRFETSMSLLAKTAQQDPDAWERFVKLYYPLVLKWCRQSGLDAAEADCVTYDVLFHAVCKLQKFKKEEPDQMFRKWIRTITRNTLVNYARQRLPAQGGTGSVFNQIAFQERHDDEVANRETDFLFRRALEIVKNNTNEKHYQAFLEVVVNGRRPKEVAIELGLNQNIVYQVKCRILKKLKAEFGGFFA